uniref:Uncharacterized protein n=1 Tax=Knipowitschia caucasica TaxID=637954 RepID=A0AAV2MEY0_KNICA
MAAEVGALKQIMNSQVSIISDLRIAASGICNRVCSLERERNERAWPCHDASYASCVCCERGPDPWGAKYGGDSDSDSTGSGGGCRDRCGEEFTGATVAKVE